MSNERREETARGDDGLGGGNDGGAVGAEGDIHGNDDGQDPTVEPTAESGAAGLLARICEHAGRGTESTKRARELPAWLSNNGKDLELQYYKGHQKRRDRVLGELQRSDGYLVRDVFRFENAREAEDFIGCLRRDKHYSRGLLQACRETTHVHVCHDCTWSNGACRCSWYQKAKTFGAHHRRDKRGHRRDPCRNRTATDIQNLLLYYCTKGRQIVYQKIGGLVERISCEGYNLSQVGPDELSEVCRQVEIQVPGDGTELREWGPDLTDDEPDERGANELPQRKRRKLGAQERIQVRIVKLCEMYPTCPPAAIVNNRVWLKDVELRFKTLADKEVKSALNNYTQQLTTWNMKDYQELYSKSDCEPVFSAGYGNFDTYYYNVENSIKILDELIEYQCGGDEDAIMDFVTTVYNVVERKIPKLNCVVVHSPSSAGKNFFFDAIKDYYINAGHLSNANKYNTFAFQDAEGRRIVMWNEPNYSPEFLDSIKELLGGDSTCVNVKYKDDCPVYRTPVIVLTNNVVTFMEHPSFNDRIRIFNWKAAPYLADYSKKPNPLAVYHLFKKYNLVD
uniref:NS1 n=1 Tax=uncultured densovirus TaxID=748192 RepID=A0A7L7YQJ1_9VIRU|nr:NS1 [uncultured densovirus]